MRVIEPLVFLESTVEQTLDQFPFLAAVFVRRGMACVGCAMARFDTLSEAAHAYRQQAEELVAELDHVARSATGHRATLSGAAGEIR